MALGLIEWWIQMWSLWFKSSIICTEEVGYNDLQLPVNYGWSSAMVWGCSSATGVGDLPKTNEIMITQKYPRILIHHATPTGNFWLVVAHFPAMSHNFYWQYYCWGTVRSFLRLFKKSYKWNQNVTFSLHNKGLPFFLSVHGQWISVNVRDCGHPWWFIPLWGLLPHGGWAEKSRGEA